MQKFYLLFLVLLLFSSVLKAQTRRISGTVTDEKNGAMPGVSIQVKGSTNGAETDVNGRYSIKVTNLQSVVIGAKFLGYNYQEKTVRPGKDTTLNFKLMPTNNSLDEVVVVGYGEQKKATLTGSVSTIDPKKIEDLPSLNLASSLVGQVPGLSINTASQRPGQPVTTVIRNPISFSKNGQGGGTLYVIDDVVRTLADFNLLDANEIESISVLKDAEAAIYGIDGGNGVIVVRTKKGKAGAPKISFSSSFGTENARQLPKMLNGLQLATWINDYHQVAAGQTPGNYIDANGYLNGDPTKKQAFWYTPDELGYFGDPANNSNYLKQEFHAANVEREAISISGGSDKVTYFIGGDYVNQNSNFSGVNSDKWGLRANVEAKPAKGLTVSLNLNDETSNSKSFWYKTKSTSENLDQDVISLTEVAPWQKYFINGYPALLNSSQGADNIDNVNVALFQNSNNYTSSLNYIMNILGKISYEIPGVDGLTASVSYNDNINNSFDKQYGTGFDYYRFSGLGDNNHIPGGTIVGSPVLITNGDRVRITPNYATAYQLDASLSYKHNFGNHHLNILGIYEQSENYFEGVNAEADGVIPTGLDNQNFTTGAQSSNQASDISESGKISYIGRVNYDYAGKYLAEAVFRRDGSTDLAPNRQYGNFGSASVGWVASEESFIKNNFTFIDLLKFRASLGLTGSDNTPAYEYAQYYNYGTGSSGGAVFGEGERGLGIKPTLIPNPYVTWDHQTKTDYGVDMAFLKNRLSVTADYYWNHNYDLLTGLSGSIPFTIGQTAPNENFAVVNTFGYEISVTWRDNIGKNWSYNISPFFAWSDDKNIREDLSPGLVGTIQDHTGKSDDQGVLGYKYTNMFRTQDEVNAFMAVHPGYNIFGQTPMPGMLNYADINGDGKIDINDLTYLSHKAANHNTFGFNFGGAYKSLSLNVVTGLSWGGQGVIPSNEITSFIAKDYTQNKAAFWNDHWTAENTNAKYPAPYYMSDYNVTSNFWFVSSFSWNIQTINLSYTLPAQWTKSLGVSSVRLYAVCNNAFSLYNPYPDGYRDPATGVLQYPELRSISLGLNVGF